MTIYKAAREVADEMLGINFSGSTKQVRKEIAELISAKFYSLVEAAKTAKRVLAETGNEATVELLDNVLEKIL